MDLTRRPATPADIPYLMQLRRATMDAHLAASGMDTSDACHEARLLHRFDCAQLLETGGRPAGLLKVVREGGCWEIVQIQLDPALQGQGVGRRLLQELIDEADAAGAGLRLKVLLNNPARQLYQRLGFAVTGIDGAEYRMERGRTA